MKRNIFFIVFIGLLLNNQPLSCMKRKRDTAFHSDFDSFEERPRKTSRKTRKKNKSISDQYYNPESETYDCPDCENYHENIHAFRQHLSKKKHGHLKPEKPSLQIRFYCSVCDYSNTRLTDLKDHLFDERHGSYNCDEKEVKKIYDRHLNKKSQYCCPGPNCTFSTVDYPDFKRHMVRADISHFEKTEEGVDILYGLRHKQSS